MKYTKELNIKHAPKDGTVIELLMNDTWMRGAWDKEQKIWFTGCVEQYEWDKNNQPTKFRFSELTSDAKRV